MVTKAMEQRRGNGFGISTARRSLIGLLARLRSKETNRRLLKERFDVYL